MAGKKAKSEEDVEQEEHAPKKGKKKLLIVGILVLLLAGAGAGLFFSGLLDGLLGKKAEVVATEEAEPKKEGEHGAEGEKKAEATPTAYFELPDIVANLNPGSATPSFIKTTIALELPNQEMLEKVQAIQPKIQDIIITYVRELRPSDLKGSAGVYRLRDELMLRINKALYPDKINNILFKELLIQ
jgi:flagellar protein FliL